MTTSSLRLWPVRIVMGMLVVAALLGAQSVVESSVDPYNKQIIVLAGVNIILAVSLNLINGITGQFSLGHAGFMAIGAYTSAAFSFYAGPRLALIDPIIFVLALLIGAVAAGIAGLLVGLPSLRLRGDYLAIVTLGFGQIIITIIRTIREVGDASGFTNLPRFTTLAWVYGAVILCILCVRNLAESNLGRSMRAVRDDEVAAEAAGVNTTRIKVLAFVISSMWAGIAGALQAHYLQLAHPDQFSFMQSVAVVVMVVLGGLGSITGSALAAVVLRVLEERLRDVSWAFGTGIALILLAAALSLPRYRLMMRRGELGGVHGWIMWLRWPAVSAIGLCCLFFYGQQWMEANVSALRYVIYALILIVLMLLRPQGLLGRGEFGWHLFRRRKQPNEETREAMAHTEPAEEETAGTLT
ncbi:MAG TPA: branched-chain amino acid ABC transporter permease [Abditibacteriaceae bacterium]|jgi:branched-chain amino acid transport system permease protein